MFKIIWPSQGHLNVILKLFERVKCRLKDMDNLQAMGKNFDNENELKRILMIEIKFLDSYEHEKKKWFMTN